MSMTGSIIEYKKFTDSPTINGKPIYLYWVEPSLPIDLPYKIEMLRKHKAWYNRLAWKKWTNRELFEWGEMYFAGHYTLFGDTNALFLTKKGENIFIENRENFPKLDNFTVTNLDTGDISYFTGDEFSALESNFKLFLN